jgi:hypothetical protein
MMDLVLYEAADQSDVQGGVLGDAAANLQDGRTKPRRGCGRSS